MSEQSPQVSQSLQRQQLCRPIGISLYKREVVGEVRPRMIDRACGPSEDGDVPARKSLGLLGVELRPCA